MQSHQNQVILIQHAFAQYSENHIKKIKQLLEITQIYLLDYLPSDIHEYIGSVLEVTKIRFKHKVINKQQLKEIINKNRRVFSFESLNQELDSLLNAAGVQLLQSLWFITPHNVTQWYQQQVSKLISNKSKLASASNSNGFKSRITQQSFYRKQTQSFGIPESLKQSSDKYNRSSIAQQQSSNVSSQLRFPFTPEQAELQLKQFLHKRYSKFAKYQDAVAPELGIVLYHSCLSMALNIGLIIPQQIAKQILEKGINNNTEAYLRQLLGWREYAICYYKYTKPVITNFKGNKRQLSKIWYKKHYKEQTKQQLQLVPVINDILQTVWEYGYIHHILRLYLLSFMIQLELHPDQIYLWMKQHFVDANDWVMSFNVYAMGYFDTRFTTKAYLFSSNYMSQQSANRYKRNEYLDALYHRFVQKYPQPRLPQSQVRDQQEMQQAQLLLDIFTE